MNIKNSGLTSLNTEKTEPIQSPRPVALICAAIDKPPPKRMSIPQGKFLVALHSSKPSPFVDGVMNNANAAMIAIP